MGNTSIYAKPRTIGDKKVAILGARGSGKGSVFMGLLYGYEQLENSEGITISSAEIKNIPAGRLLKRHSVTLSSYDTVDVDSAANTDYLLYVLDASRVSEYYLVQMLECISRFPHFTKIVVVVNKTDLVPDTTEIGVFLEQHMPPALRDRRSTIYINNKSKKEFSKVKDELHRLEDPDIKEYDRSASLFCPAREKSKDVGYLHSFKAGI